MIEVFSLRIAQNKLKSRLVPGSLEMCGAVTTSRPLKNVHPFIPLIHNESTSQVNVTKLHHFYSFKAF